MEMQEVKIGSSLNLYSGVRGIAVKILNRVDRTDAYLDKLLEIEIKNSELSSKDKALLFEIVHGVIRWLGKIDWILNGFYKGQFSKCIPNVKNSMRVALYQILFLDKIPNHAAVNESVEFVKKLQGEKSANLTNAVLRNIIRNQQGIRYPNREEDLVGYLSAFHSHPSWMVKRWINRFGEEDTEQLLVANNKRPSHTIRVNNIKTNVNELKSLLTSVELGFTQSKYFDEYFQLNQLTNITSWEYFQKGYFTIQDESTGFSCKALDPKPGMKILDLCAAPGGKSAFLADMMNNEGQIIALDKFESRLELFNRNIERLGITNVKTVAIDAMKFNEKDFDGVLADVPCSGLGTLTKKPDIKWKKDFGDIRKLNKVQLGLLTKACSLVKVGGTVVYSTCTIEPEENIKIVKQFLDNNDNFELVSLKDQFSEELIDENGCVQTLPHKHKIDGAFVAKLIRKS
ncbi:MAG: 16S rRNA (cytosine(967)-C(5))-methyltransferase RsmB [Ignavibacteriae bacterium]|nr:16S rRNA (cytosine(967)-C(5))-methyltransferase RsmB [Ignavibacteriota bacterium]MCB9206831.1 16S rRNA (cytosine(967)-C(5))-methyltransferase RsmB [Ignavibacteriales bacterium]MCB9210160.1 16S rRNA (cytosine(967)-C(5))-methyltransferase RsmB [Ignavibacteriales bacterium]MCB9218455.1 16S rRNA (cytosine(967)-C(5))-methyltransferase RsmB [Ignavibacteriales bacterium]MCB9259539.1 16S rRNA (cytosine(967)-C(5))-methyltransferase RsmB [Ignavibacteriales bacterium]